MSNVELSRVIGGASSTWLNSLARCISVIYDLGRSLGSSLNYLIKGKSCN